MPDSSAEWTLTEVAQILGEPQHRLIYLCEKGVVRPDLQDAEGRGSSRRFSARNLLEFAVALRLRDFELPAGLVATVVHVLRAFEGAVRRRQIAGFRLPESLRSARAPDLRVVIGDGHRLYFTLGDGSGSPKVYGGVDLRDLGGEAMAGRRLERKLVPIEPLAGEIREPVGSAFGGPEGSRHARVEVSITGIAQDLPLGA